MAATITLTPGTSQIGYIVRYGGDSWEAKDVDSDQFIDVPKVASGTVHIYVESGVPGCTAEVHKDHPDVTFYGDGWTMDSDITKEGVTMATQVNPKETPGFAYFSDTIRDGLKGSVFDTSATVLCRLEGKPSVAKPAFSDVSSNAYYASAAAWATATGVTSSANNNQFMPDSVLTYGQLADVLYHYAALKGYDTSATDTIAWAEKEALTNGLNTALTPKDNVSRAQLAAILTRFCNNHAN